ncbi:hypothetical protein F511_21788 [Dorcoceras hygrometricum]|uniref:Uncharacterized protein n=1 Tax=Dorcoceras hygrometricum TaxID=472368 RepID=A0A2Z7BJS8_9LAMI|nr:hypothetical protein F511_21788 [Dorcoceras hygrometricum]
MSRIAAPFQAHGRVHHRATNCASSSMHRPTGCATSAAHRRPASKNRAARAQSKLGVEQSWSLEATQEQERTKQAQLQTKRGADAEAALEDQLKDENNEAGEEKKKALYELKKQPA